MSFVVAATAATEEAADRYWKGCFCFTSKFRALLWFCSKLPPLVD